MSSEVHDRETQPDWGVGGEDKQELYPEATQIRKLSLGVKQVVRRRREHSAKRESSTCKDPGL